ncbi:Ras GTPase-activating protein-binding protein 1 [Sciurus carolinensis]|uniref:Ras GTPase-activating protein-binding protein 1 n=1 Tax=Sciurus carolinensis TaxID=30640 RepID=A0AA41T8U8_SCICA|nr:Ras GTPase-activating protein-binding protein 1 [Sciurus carolinensis]
MNTLNSKEEEKMIAGYHLNPIVPETAFVVLHNPLRMYDVLHETALTCKTFSDLKWIEMIKVRFYGKDSSYVRGELDSDGKLFTGNLPHEVDKSELKDFFQNYGNVVELCINSGGKLPNFGFVVFDDSEPVQKVLSNRPIIFRDEVFGGFATEPQEESEEEVEEPDERQQTPEVVPDDSGTFCDQTVSNDLEERLEEPVVEPKPDPEPEPEQEPVSEIQEEKSEPVSGEPAPEDAQKSSPAPTDIAQTVQEDLRTFS